MPNYRKAPITEAIIEIQSRAAAGTTVESLSEFFTEAQRQSLHFQSTMKAEIQFRLRQESGSPASAHQAGWTIYNPDERTVLQTRLDGFTFIQLAPYESWEKFRERARELWLRYCDVAVTEAVTRLSLKYVNKFDIPLPVRDFKDFFRTYPEVSPDMPQGLAGFFVQLQVPYEELRSMAVLTQTIVPPPQAGVVSVVLDIELVRANNVPAQREDVWMIFEQLRQKKNDIFEACITDAARELIR